MNVKTLKIACAILCSGLALAANAKTVKMPAFVATVNKGALNEAGHPTTIVVPGTSQVDALPPGDNFPLRVRIQKTADLKHDTDLLIDQVRAISNARFMFRYCTVPPNLRKRVEEALRLLTTR